jgi:leucyl/phenylalanyl-tRNA--protein transferase
MPVFRLRPNLPFPPPEMAEPEGLLAVGGDLSLRRLLAAYRAGIFPWYEEGSPILWWSPDPRFVLLPADFHVPDSLRRIVRTGRFRVTFDAEFHRVMESCGATPRRHETGTWITPEMVRAYVALHEAGHAHSVEVWLGDELAGGLYGVSVGACFCGESMFTRVSNASKVGFVTLVERLKRQGCALIDCQMETDHLRRFGAVAIPRAEYLRRLDEAAHRGERPGKWPAE